MMKSQNGNAVVFVLAVIIIVILSSYLFYPHYLFHSHFDPMPSPAEIRAPLEAKCGGRAGMIAEIERELPDNGKGMITAKIMKQVLEDVVRECGE